MKWYQEVYFDKKMWLLANYDKLNITNNELVLLLLIIFAQESKTKIDYTFLSNKTKLSNKELDTIMAKLVDKKYLKITSNKSGIGFDISGVFEFDPSQYELVENKDIFDTLTDLFKRPLNQIEMQAASDLIKKYGIDKFDDALRIAEAYNKVNMRYIETVLNKNENK